MLATVLLLAAAAYPEIEIGAGFAHPLDQPPSSSYPLATGLVQARVAVDFLDQWSLGASALGILGSEGFNGATGSDTSGLGAFRAFAAVLALRFHSSGDTQGWLEAGGGVGHLINLQTDDAFEVPGAEQVHRIAATNCKADVSETICESCFSSEMIAAHLAAHRRLIRCRAALLVGLYDLELLEVC